MKNLFAGLCLLVALAGCASPPDTQAQYDRHTAQFNAAQPHTTHTIVRPDGLRLHAREFGAAFRGQGPSLVLMHGFPDNGHLYDALVPELSSRFHVITFDFLGWGQSDKPAVHDYRVASQRTDLEAVVAQLDLQQVVPVVHDLSGQAGIDWALDNEARTAAVVLLNTYYTPMPTLVAPEAIQFYSTPGVLRNLMVWAATKSGINFQSGVASQLTAFFKNADARERYLPVVTHGASAMRPAFFSATAALWPEVQARQAQLPRLQRFGRPVHVVFGEADPYLNAGVAAEFRQLFPVGSLHLVSGAGHYVQLDDPVAVGRILREALKPLPALR
jgi:haloalkane dehalogenase